MKFKFIVTLICCILYFLGTKAQDITVKQKELSFEDALFITNENSFILKQSQNNVLQKEQELKASRGLFMPKVSLNASYVFMSEDLNLDLNPVKDAITPIYSALGNYGTFSGVPNPDPTTSGVMPFLPDDVSTQIVRGQLLEGLNTINSSDWVKTIQKKEFGYLSAGFTQPIYTGGKIIAANKAAKIKVEEARTENKQKQFELSSELVERYYALVLSQNAKEIRYEVKKTMEAHLSDAEKMMGQGIIAKAEYLHAKVYSSEADREYKKAIRQFRIINDALINTLALDENINIIPVSNLFYLDKIEPLEYFWNNASEKSPLLQKIEKKKELAYQGYKLEQSEYFPTIAAIGTYDILNKDLSPYVPEYLVGVTMKWDLFSGTSRIRKVKASKYQQKQVDNFYDKAKADIKTAITKYYQELNMYLEQLNELESALEFANEYYRVREKAFKEGMATTTEVSDASLALAKVKIERLEVIYNYDVSLSKLLYFSGISPEFEKYQKNNNAKYETY